MWFLVLISLFACSGQPVKSSCPVEMDPPKGLVRFGEPFSAICKTLSNQTEGMGWESPLGSTQLTEGVTSLDLKIDTVTLWALEPMCYINDPDDNQCSKVLPVTVYHTPNISISELKGPMEADQNYSIQCDIVNVAPVRALTVLWFIDDDQEFTEKFKEQTITPVNKSSVLMLTAHRDHNGARIWCKPKLDFGPTAPSPYIAPAFVEAVVLYPPSFIDPANETHEIPAGKEMNLNCTATGNPSPKYSWQSPQDTRQGNKIQKENQPILTTPFEVPGTYKCTASNTQGTTTKFYTVTETKRNRTTFAALVGGFVSLGVLLVVAGLFFVKPDDGTFAFNKSSYLKGKPSSGPV